MSLFSTDDILYNGHAIGCCYLVFCFHGYCNVLVDCCCHFGHVCFLYSVNFRHVLWGVMAVYVVLVRDPNLSSICWILKFNSWFKYFVCRLHWESGILFLFEWAHCHSLSSAACWPYYSFALVWEGVKLMETLALQEISLQWIPKLLYEEADPFLFSAVGWPFLTTSS